MRDALISVLLVGAGGFAGSVLRFGVQMATQRLWPVATFPLATLIVNVVGCFVIGLVAAAADVRGVPQGLWAFLAIGLLGGFTTFSSFGLESLFLLREGLTARAALSVGLNVVMSLVAVAGGFRLGRVLSSLTNL